MEQAKVTVRASQRFEDWADGEVRIVDRTRRVERLLANGVLVEAPEALLEGRALDYQRAEQPTEYSAPGLGTVDAHGPVVAYVEMGDAVPVPTSISEVVAPATDRQPPPKRGRAPRTRQVDPEPDATPDAPE